MWWESTDHGIIPINRVKVKCPVCKEVLTTRFPEDRIWTYCKECKTNFYYPPNKDIPTQAKPDSLKYDSKKCNCGRCNR